MRRPPLLGPMDRIGASTLGVSGPKRGSTPGRSAPFVNLPTTVPVLPLGLKDCDTHIQIIFAQGAEVPRKFFVGTMDTYPGTYQEEGVSKFVGKIEFVINRWR